MKISRRDTIVIAVLVNVALLAALFATATIVEEKTAQRVVLKENGSQVVQEPLAKNTMSTSEIFVEADRQATTDEIDQILQQYALKQKLFAAAIEEPKQEVGFEEKVTTVEPATIAAQLPQKKEIAKKVEVAPEVVATPVVTPPAQIVTAQKEESIEIVVQKGDVLGRIAKSHGVTVADILRVNNLKNDKLKIGQKLKIVKKAQVSEPIIPAPIPAAFAKEVSQEENSVEFYIVKSGDNPWKIARRFNLKYDELLSLNDLDEEKAKSLKIGQKLRIR